MPKFSSTLNSEASTDRLIHSQQITQKLPDQKAQTSALDLKQHNPNNSSTQPLNSSQQHITQKSPNQRAQTSAWDLKQQHPNYSSTQSSNSSQQQATSAKAKSTALKLEQSALISSLYLHDPEPAQTCY